MEDSSQKRHTKDIPIRIDGVTRYIKNVTKITTCCDVIKMILRKLNIGKENLPYYTIFESANGVDRPLAGKTFILKTMRSWGSDTGYKFIMRKSAPAVTYVTHLSSASRQKLSQWSKSSSSLSSRESVETDKERDVKTLEETVKKQRRKHLKNKYRISDRELSRQLFADDTSDSDSMDEFMSQVDSQKLTEFWDFCTAVTESEIKRLENKGIPRSRISENCLHSRLGTSSDVKFAKRKQLKKCESVGNVKASDGKQELLQKYFSEISDYETPKIAKMKKAKRRTDRDFMSNGNVNTEIMSSNARGHSYSDVNAFYWSVHAENDSEGTDLDSSLERAFVAECNISDSSYDSGIKVNVHDKNSDDLNTGEYMYDNSNKLVDYSMSDEEADTSSVNSRDFDVREFWKSGEEYNEDDAMDSFMNTKLRDDFSDEGLSSMGSDEEKETFV